MSQKSETHPGKALSPRHRLAHLPVDRRVGLIYAVIAVVFFGSSAALVLFASPIPPLEISFERLIVATGFIWVLMLLKGEKPGITLKQLSRFSVYGFITAAHFALYIISLKFTTPAHCLTLVYTSPVFVALFSAIFLKEKLAARRWIGIGVAAVGVGILAGFEPKISQDVIIGDALALGSAVAYGFYSIAGRHERKNYSLFTYALGVYGVASIWMFPLALISFMVGNGIANYTNWNILAVLALGIFPLGLGHTLYNAGLRRMNATYVNIVATQEVTLGILFTWLFNNQTPSLNSLAGAATTLIGILIVLR